MSLSNITESKKSKKWSGLYTTGAVAAILIIVAAVWSNNLSGSRKAQLDELSNKLSEEGSVLKNDMILHKHFKRLQELDEKYGQLLINSPTPAQLDNAMLSITAAETAMKKSLDSIHKQSSKYNAWDNVVMTDSIVSSFNKALANRKYIARIRSSIGNKPVEIKKDDTELLQMEFDLQEKDERIATLEKELKAKPKVNALVGALTSTSNKAESQKQAELQKQYNALLTNLKEEEMRNTGLLDLTRTLKQDNEKLLTEVNKLKRNSPAASTDDGSSAASKNKVSSLQDQINDLNAELNFAKVDCNLSRADAKKIISNSRQRKELLAEALQSLQSLSKSDNASVQKRAKEKLKELNQIASTVRD